MQNQIIKSGFIESVKERISIFNNESNSVIYNELANLMVIRVPHDTDQENLLYIVSDCIENEWSTTLGDDPKFECTYKISYENQEIILTVQLLNHFIEWEVERW